MNILDKLLGKWYISKSKHKRELNLLQDSLHTAQQEYKILRDAKMDSLLKAITSVHMTKVEIESPNGATLFTDEKYSNKPHFAINYPQQSEWFHIRLALDITAAQRIYHEFLMDDNSVEYEYFKKSLFYKFEHDIDTLMRLHGVIK